MLSLLLLLGAAAAAGEAPMTLSGVAGCPCETGVPREQSAAELEAQVRALAGRCSAKKVDGGYWTYKLCHFEALQQLDGGTTISLGQAGAVALQEADGAAFALPQLNVSFSGGDACGEGDGLRSAVVAYVCDVGDGGGVAVKEALLSAAEPEPCRYELRFGAPQMCPAFDGPTLAISGSGFSESAHPRAVVGGKTCQSTTVVSPTLLECRLPDTLSGSDLRVQVTQGRASAELPAAVSFLPPRVSHVEGSGGATTGGGKLHVFGKGFGASGASVTVGQVPCARVAVVTKHTHLLCTLAAGAGGNMTVAVTVGAQVGRWEGGAVAYAAPTLTRVSGCPAEGCSTAGGGVALQLSGTNFGTHGARVRVGGRDCAVTKNAHNQIHCQLPAGVGASADVEVEQSGAVASMAGAVKYAPPRITGVSGCSTAAQAPTAETAAEECPVEGGVEVTIAGSNFGFAGEDVGVRLLRDGASVPLEGCELRRSHELIVCSLAAGEGANWAVEVEVGGQAASAALAVSYAGARLMGADAVDFEALGIGGLDQELTDIMRRVALSRQLSPSARQRFGVSHVKGVLLYGPPGTGKTLIGRHLCTILSCANFTVVNGPEIMHKYLGQSEENLRKVFAAAEAEFAEKGERSGLHVLVFDEIDAISKPRGRGEEVASSVYDSVVNTLLTKLDGMSQQTNIIVVGTTNRFELLDKALLRPGRFEVHVEVGLPTQEGRESILRIHTRDMAALGADVSVSALAARTDRMTGAELKGLVASATSFALERFMGGEQAGGQEEEQVGMADFERALQEVTPTHGVSLTEYAHLLEKPWVLDSAPELRALVDRAQRFVRRLHAAPAGTSLAALVTGPPSAGKSTFAAQLAAAGNFSSVQVVRAADLVELSAQRRLERVTDAFRGGMGAVRCVVLDDVDRLVELQHFGASPSSAQLTFSQQVVQTLLLLLRGVDSSDARTLVLATATWKIQVQKTSLVDGFDVFFDLPPWDAVELLRSRHALSPAGAAALQEAVRGVPLAGDGMRKLILAADLSGSSEEGMLDMEAFEENMEAFGLAAAYGVGARLG